MWLTCEEKVRIRQGWQCPECFGSSVNTRSRGAFQCQECGCQWLADAPQFQPLKETM